MKLAQLQSLIVQQLTGNPSDNTQLLKQLTPVGQISTKRQIDIYQRNINGAYFKVLQTIYPICEKIVGNQYFKQLANTYIKDHPSQGHDLNFYGHIFPEYLQECCNSKSELSELAYLSDLATLEQCWHNTHYSDDDDPFDFNRFATLSSEQHSNLKFVVSHTLTLITTNFPILEIWKINKNMVSQREVSLPQQQEILCIYREQYEVKIEKISQEAFQTLNAIKKGSSLTELAESFSDINQQLTLFIERGWLTGFNCQ